MQQLFVVVKIAEWRDSGKQRNGEPKPGYLAPKDRRPLLPDPSLRLPLRLSEALRIVEHWQEQ